MVATPQPASCPLRFSVTFGDAVAVAPWLIAMLPLGGGKSALVADPARFPKGSAPRRELIGWYASLLELLPEYTPGPDMFTDEADMQQIFEQAGRSIGRPADKGGIPIDLLGLTSLGVLTDLKTAIDGGHLPGVKSLAGLRLAVEGFGNVGSAFAVMAAPSRPYFS